MKREKLLKHLKAHGCILYREGGKHSVFINISTEKMSTVPRHPDIKRFTVANICKDLEIPVPSEK
jgi:predicted RNA binding protein YcfA (HicA-like mRNA interferase family)